jgi:hypothetical protein
MFPKALRNKLEGNDSKRQTRHAGNIVIGFRRTRSA